MFSNLSWWIETLTYAFFAAIGGVMGHVMRTVNAKEPIDWAYATLEGIAAGFVGVLVLLTCRALDIPDLWIGVIVGISGWLGANSSIALLEKVIYKKFGIDKTDTDK